jgi:hypothetical protein
VSPRYDPPRLERITWLDDGYEVDGRYLVAHEGETKVVFTRVALNGRLLSDPMVVEHVHVLEREEIFEVPA